MMLAKVLYMGLQDPCHLGREGKNLISLQRRRFSILMCWKIRWGLAWDIFHGCTKELPSIAIDTCLCFFHSHIINPRKILHFFYSHVHITNKWAYQPCKVHSYLYHWASPQHQCLYSSSQGLCFPHPNKITFHTHACSFKLFG